MADSKTAAGKPTTKTTAAKTSQVVASTETRSPTPTGGATSARTTDAKATVGVATATTSTPSTPSTPPAPSVAYGKRLGVTLNVATVANAFHNALASRSVRYVQYALHDRGFEPGNDVGRVDYDTRRAYAEFQRSIDERPTGVPTDYSLNILGFDVS